MGLYSAYKTLLCVACVRFGFELGYLLVVVLLLHEAACLLLEFELFVDCFILLVCVCVGLHWFDLCVLRITDCLLWDTCCLF